MADTEAAPLAADRVMKLLLEVLVDPRCALRLDNGGWNRLLLEARYYGLLARLGLELARHGHCDVVPAGAERQIQAAIAAAEANQAALRYEITRVREALCGRGFPVVLLKGGAYLAADMPAAQGRTACDLDILVPRECLAEAEAALCAAGWEVKVADAYDDRYYREWMHELPPLWHPERDMSLDVHHTIFPPVSGLAIDGARLLAAARPLGGGLFVLSSCDLVLHAALHLFGEDMTNRLRDLVDLRDLILNAANEPDFWPTLTARAQELGADWALNHALYNLVTLLGVSLPSAVRATVMPHRHPLRWLTRRTLTASLLGGIPGEVGFWQATAQFWAYVRSHLLRMPLPILARHIWVKAWRYRQVDARGRG